MGKDKGFQRNHNVRSVYDNSKFHQKTKGKELIKNFNHKKDAKFV